LNVKMKKVEAAYIAGLMDGEGCFTIVKSKAENTPIKTQYGIRVEFCMCDREPIELIANRFDRPVSTRNLKSGRTGYIVILHSAKAASFIKSVLPYLLGKRQQAVLLLTLFEKHLPGRGKMHTEASVAAIEALRTELYYLKRSHLLRC
jgi:hypothetical protein